MLYSSPAFLGFLALGVTTAKAWSNQAYKTESFTAPVFNTTKSRSPLAPGLTFFSPIDYYQEAAMIMTDEGELVWSAATGNYMNVLLQTLDGKSVLTYWSGAGTPQVLAAGHGYGSVTILDSTYTPLYTICPDLGLTFLDGATSECQADLHESYITETGTLLVTAYNLTQADLTAVGGAADGWVWDSMFFEINIKTGAILFSWSAINAGIPIASSKQPLDGAGTSDNPFDWFHINSVQSVGNNYLINSRNLWTVYLINSKGKIEWEFEGEGGGNFILPSGVHFQWEHHTRVQSSTETNYIISIFDNANSSPPYNGTNQTIGYEFNLNLLTKIATVLHAFSDPTDPQYVDTQGSISPLSNGNWFMGYGQIPKMKEYTSAGDVAMSIQWETINQAVSYRAFRQEWTATPAALPNAVVQNGTVYMSWNGATEVTNWKVNEGKTANTLWKTQSISNCGFESNATLSATSSYVQVAAYNGLTFLRNSTVVEIN